MTAGRRKVVHYYASYLQHPSGVTDSLNHWAEASVASGDEVLIVAAKPTGQDRNEFALLSRTKVVSHLGNGRSTWLPIGLHREINKGDSVVLHEGWVLSNIFAGIVSRSRGASVVIIPHGVYEKPIMKQIRDVFGIRALLERWAIRRADAVHVFYSGEQDVVRQFEPSVRAFITVPNGAPEIAQDAKWTGNGDYFLWVGRFDVFHKGLDNLLNYWSRLPEPRPKLRLVGPDYNGGRDTVSEMIVNLKLEDVVEVQGRVSGHEKDVLLAECLAYIHPSRWESCSIMLLEALATGVPSLISSSIHAAGELEPLGVLLSIDFESIDDRDIGMLTVVGSNAALGAKAGQWARDKSNWSDLGAEMVAAQSRLGLNGHR